MRVEATGRLDPFRISRAPTSCFDDPAMGRRLVDAVADGGKEQAACLLEACIGMGLARKGAPRVLAYLRNNMPPIAEEGPSLSTMGSENQHLYKSRMAAAPCAWPRRGASDMARLRSRSRSGRAVPPRTRTGSATPLRRRRDGLREGGGARARGAARRVRAAELRGGVRAAQGIGGWQVGRRALCCRRRLRGGRGRSVRGQVDATPIKVTPSAATTMEIFTHVNMASKHAAMDVMQAAYA